jgi:hypothetical protein
MIGEVADSNKKHIEALIGQSRSYLYLLLNYSKYPVDFFAVK